ncbi:MAG: cytochrome P460 family protein [Desulfobulbaceae bacterium]|nr:MAG: cytochrome P460 family protein [Desulfobulbaceae bacterium]
MNNTIEWKISFARNVMLFTTLMTATPEVVFADGDLVKFPEKYREGVLYTTVHRGGITEDIYTSRAAIEAVKAGRPIPSGTVITLVDYREGALFRYVVMEKRSGWGSDYPPDLRNGEWEFQAFNADKSLNTQENLIRCFSCHKSEAENEFIFTMDAMKNSE